jgi:hypothetical protein
LGASIKGPPGRVCRRLEHKKEGVSEDSPLQYVRLRVLEIEADCELDLPHCSAVFDVRNFPVVAALAINAGIPAIVRTEGINRVVEQVEEIRAELRTEPFVDLEFLHYR